MTHLLDFLERSLQSFEDNSYIRIVLLNGAGRI